MTGSLLLFRIRDILTFLEASLALCLGISVCLVLLLVSQIHLVDDCLDTVCSLYRRALSVPLASALASAPETRSWRDHLGESVF